MIALAMGSAKILLVIVTLVSAALIVAHSLASTTVQTVELVLMVHAIALVHGEELIALF